MWEKITFWCLRDWLEVSWTFFCNTISFFQLLTVQSVNWYNETVARKVLPRFPWDYPGVEQKQKHRCLLSSLFFLFFLFIFFFFGASSSQVIWKMMIKMMKRPGWVSFFSNMICFFYFRTLAGPPYLWGANIKTELWQGCIWLVHSAETAHLIFSLPSPLTVYLVNHQK